MGETIRNNVGDVAAMKKAVWDIFNHRNGEHDHRPNWCPAHKGDMEAANKNKRLPFIMDEIKPGIKELASAERFGKCKHCGTQNVNEAFHHSIWQRCPKSVFVERKEGNVLSCLWDGAYKRTLAANRKKSSLVAAAGFLSRYLNGS